MTRQLTLGSIAIVMGTLGAPSHAWAQSAPVPLKEAKLIIEHNATVGDTGFQGFIDSEGWQDITVSGPDGKVLHFEGLGSLGKLGLTELFFETVEPENAKVPIETMLKMLPEGDYTIEGQVMMNGEGGSQTIGIARFTHAIPSGPELLAPADKSVVPATGLTMQWAPVTTTIEGKPVNIVAYQLIIETDKDPAADSIGRPGQLSIYLPPSTTSLAVPDGFLMKGTEYLWEVLAIEESGNQTLSSGEFSTE